MSEKFLVVCFSDGSSWEIPAMVIATSRAGYYAQLDSERHGDDYDEVFKSEVEYAMRETDELTTWAHSNMDWADVEAHAIRISNAEPSDKAEEWTNADMEIQSL